MKTVEITDTTGDLLTVRTPVVQPHGPRLWLRADDLRTHSDPFHTLIELDMDGVRALAEALIQFLRENANAT